MNIFQEFNETYQIWFFYFLIYHYIQVNANFRYLWKCKYLKNIEGTSFITVIETSKYIIPISLSNKCTANVVSALTFDILVTRNNVKCMAQTANAKIHTYTRDWQWLSSKWRGSFSRWIFRAYENKCVRKNCIREIKNLILQNVRPPTRRSTCTYFSRDSRHFSIKRNHAFCTDET